MKGIYKIISLSEPQSIVKKDGSNCIKHTLTLQELGGKYEDQYVATLLCDYPTYLKQGTVIAASLRFSVRTYEDQDYQDILLQEYISLYTNPMGNLPTIPQT